MKQKILSYGIALCATGVAQAIELPEIIGNDMVLQQQQKNAKLWGWAKPGNYVTVTTGWNKECYQVKTDDSGRWELGIATPTASFDKHELTFREKPSAVRPSATTSVCVLSSSSATSTACIRPTPATIWLR